MESVVATVRADFAALTAANQQLIFDNQQLRSENQLLSTRVQEQASSSAFISQPLRQPPEMLSVHNTMQDDTTARKAESQVSGACCKYE